MSESSELEFEEEFEEEFKEEFEEESGEETFEEELLIFTISLKSYFGSHNF